MGILTHACTPWAAESGQLSTESNITPQGNKDRLWVQKEGDEATRRTRCRISAQSCLCLLLLVSRVMAEGSAFLLRQTHLEERFLALRTCWEENVPLLGTFCLCVADFPAWSCINVFVCLRKCVVCASMFAANNKNKKKFHITRNGKPKGFPLCQFQTKYLCSSSLLLEQLVPEITHIMVPYSHWHHMEAVYSKRVAEMESSKQSEALYFWKLWPCWKSITNLPFVLLLLFLLIANKKPGLWVGFVCISYSWELWKHI